ncbi:MAG: 4-hydroxybenzoate octaprenyltransferase [Tistlia sp.]|uniref:4-hydroxybenzoate octaprenyltransferase n=1 Tax=Tistlia sp. TaxID=3057121 RepID=UPI0034A26A12
MSRPAPSGAPSGASDIRADAPVLRLAPEGWRPYLRLARLDRPIGTWLLLFPCWWSIALAQASLGQAPDLWLYLLFGVGAMVMRGAGCTVNDLLDRHYDARVARTAERPIPSGQVSPRQALAFLAGLLLLGLAILLQLSEAAAWLGLASLLLVFPYPLMKRITYWPQLWLGLTFNWGALMGWAAVTGSLDWPPVLLYLAGIFWTLGYDTIYAHQDKEDDALIGVKSSALKLGTRTRPWLVGFYAAALLLFAAAGGAAGLAWPFYLGLLGVAAQLAWQVRRLEIDDPRRCLLLFRSNRWTGWLLLAGLLAAPLAA